MVVSYWQQAKVSNARMTGTFSFVSLVISLLVLSSCQSNDEVSAATAVPEQFVELGEFIPGIHLDVRYFGVDNFVGGRIDGYEAAKIYMSRPAAEALANLQQQLLAMDLSLKVFDAYRPQRAVNHFIRWAQDLQDTRMKDRFYPSVDKQNLFSEGYISERSGHSRGSTIDLTLVHIANGEELDMGSPWDFFDPVSWPSSNEVTEQQLENRMLLQSLMVEYGFVSIRTEWWHFYFADEPFPDDYFDFVIR